MLTGSFGRRKVVGVSVIQAVLAVASGGLVGFSLGLIGGGGSVLAVPLLLYVVGVRDPHLAIGTSALAVAVNAFANLVPHARAGHVRWVPAFIFSGGGVIGAFAGSAAGKAFDGQRLLLLFALLMLVIAALMQRKRPVVAASELAMTPARAVRFALTGAVTGVLAGFFGIGGGFLIVPGLCMVCGLATIDAIGTSLVSVGAFGLTTSINYALSGLVIWPIAGLFIAGGVLGGIGGARCAARLSLNKQALNQVFGAIVTLVALYMLAHSFGLLS